MSRRPPKLAPDPIDLYVGSRVRARRVGLRLSQTKLGEAIGVTFQQVQKYENGANRIGASNLAKIARTLGVEVGYFFENMPESCYIDNPDTPGLSDHDIEPFEHDPLSSREAIQLTHNYFKIEDDQLRKRLFQFVRSLADTLSTEDALDDED